MPVRKTKRGESRLSALEAEAIAYFVPAAVMLGMPRSLGEIYGLLFASPRPLSFQDIVERLNASKGTVSYGLRTLRGLGALRVVYVEADRRDHYELELEMRPVLTAFLRGKVGPILESGTTRLAALKERLANGADSLDAANGAVLRGRVEKLEGWQGRGGLLLQALAEALD